MPNTPKDLLSYVRVIVGAWQDDPRGDAQLLARFAEVRDEKAFTALLWRHGRLVWRTCTRVLGSGPDAEDAFQATFLALACKASQLRADTLAGWLHRVARQTALKTEADARRRWRLEQRLRAVTPSPTEGDADWAELYAALDEELAGLPEKLRVALLLHYVESKSQDEVAHFLGCSRGAVRKRLARGEAILRQRLTGRGLTVSAVGALLTSSVAVSALPAGLIGGTARAALRSLSFPLSESSKTALLAEGVMKTMLVAKMKLVTVLTGLTLCLAGGGLVAYQALAGNGTEPPQSASETRGQTEAFGQPAAATRVDCLGDPLPPRALARMGTTRLWLQREWSGGKSTFAFSPDGKTLATSIKGMTICLWDVASGKEIRRLTTEAFTRNRNGWLPPIMSLGFSLDGKTLVTVNYDQTVYRWEAATGKFLGKQLCQAKKDNVNSLQVAFLPDGQILGFGDFLKSAEEGRGMYVWDVATGKEICQLNEPRKKKERLIGLSAFSADGKMLATVTNGEKIIYLWEVATGKEIRQLTTEGGQNSSVDAVIFSPDGKILASGDRENFCVWEIATGKKLHRFQKAEAFSCLLAYSPDGKTLFGGSGKAHHLWDAGTGKEIRSFDGENAHAALFSPDGKILAVGDHAGSIRLWEVATGKEIGPRMGFRGPIQSIVYSPDGKTLASLGMDGAVRQWETATGKEMRPLAKHDWGRGSISYSPDGKILVSLFNLIHLWDTATGKEIPRIVNRDRSWAPRVAAFSPDGKKLAACIGVDCTIRLWDVATGKELYSVEIEDPDNIMSSVISKVESIAFSPDGRVLATPGKDNTVSLWWAATGTPIGQLGGSKPLAGQGKQRFVRYLAFSPDSRLLATSSREDDKIHLWEVITGKEIGQLDGFNQREGNIPSARGEGCSLAFSPDGRMLATAPQGRNLTGEVDRKVHLWEVATGKKIGQLTGHRSSVRTIAFSPDGKTLASGSDDLTCLVWDITSFAGRLKSVRTRPLPPKVLSRKQLEAAWAELAGGDPTKAYAAVWTLQAVPTQAIALVQARVRPVAPVADPQQLKRWIADLDDNNFAVRDKAQREIEKLGEPAIPALQQALKGRPALEMKRRLQDLLVRVQPSKETDGSLRPSRELWAVQVLEMIGTAEARQHLQALAKGVPEASLTREAQAALTRLSNRVADKP